MNTPRAIRGWTGKLWLAAAAWVAVCTLAGSLAMAADPEAKAPQLAIKDKSRFHLYLLIGQSNMAGRGTVEPGDKVPHPRVWMYTAQKEWAPAVDPLHFDKPIAGVGLGSSFGRAMADADPEVTIGLVPCAVGGTPLSRWQKGGDLWKQAMERIVAAQKDGTLRGVLWHQGEADSGSAETANSYGQRLGQMIVDLRQELGQSELPFVAGQLGLFLRDKNSKGAESYWKVVNQQLADVASRVPYTALVSSADLKHKGDEVHFNSAGLREFGRRYAQAMQQLQKSK